MQFNMSGAAPACGCAQTRRGFFGTLAGGVAAAAALPSLAAKAPAARNIVDVHAHYNPPSWRGGGPMAAWSLAKHLDEMEKAGVQRSMLSITTPGANGQGEQRQAQIRAANEYAAKLCSDQPAQFGAFTYVDLNNIADSLSEIAYGFDVLKANGVGLFTSYSGKYLGDPAFDAVFEELNRRKAIVYIHPTNAACCTGVLPQIPDTIIEFGTDTTRAITRYIYSGAARRYPDVKMIWSHSGGSLPFLIERYDFADRGGQFSKAAPQGFRAELAKFYFDVAQASNPVATTALRGVVPVDKIVFGTDYPFRTPLEHVQQIETGGVFNRTERAALYYGNVQRGLPGLLA